MAYCTLAELQSMMDQVFSTTTSPTAAEVTAMIDDVASEIDGVLRAAGYATPVTVAEALGLLGRMNRFGVAPEAFYGGALTEVEPPRVKYWRETYEAFLSRVRRGEQQIPGLDPESDIDPAFTITPGIQREEYWLTNQEVAP